MARPEPSEPFSTKPAESGASLSSPSDVRQLARSLEAHGGASVAGDLALDLVLNEVVERARVETHASGAAVALIRAGEMICRAASGRNAPDLGVRVETSAGLSGVCLATGQIQHCFDTEADPRVNAETCRELGVRSMLMAPLVDEGRILGILEVFSDQGGAFDDRDRQTLSDLAKTIVRNKREAEAALTPAVIPVESSSAKKAIEESAIEMPAEISAPADSGDHWTSVLGILVIAAAVALGVAIGWKEALRGAHSARMRESRALPSSGNPTPVEAPVPDRASASGQTESAPLPAAPPPGGLVISQNGKVLYRSSPQTAAQSAGVRQSQEARLVQRVEPDYPLEAREKHIQGSVVLAVQVMADGTVGKVDVVSGDALLKPAAVQAVRQWKYQPSVVNGRPVETQTQITINFTLPSS